MDKSPSEYFRACVIGTVKTKELTMTWTSAGVEKPVTYPSADYEVIQIIMMGDSQAYVTNQWHKEYRKEPLILVESLVEIFTPKAQA